MSKKKFWDKQIVLHCPKCEKAYKSRASMMAHFSREHAAVRLEERLELFQQAIDNWAAKHKRRK